MFRDRDSQVPYLSAVHSWRSYSPSLGFGEEYIQDHVVGPEGTHVLQVTTQVWPLPRYPTSPCPALPSPPTSNNQRIWRTRLGGASWGDSQESDRALLWGALKTEAQPPGQETPGICSPQEQASAPRPPDDGFVQTSVGPAATGAGSLGGVSGFRPNFATLPAPPLC